MAWQSSRYMKYPSSIERGRFPSSPGIANEKCFVRKEHPCGKYFGASKSCFIACPSEKKLDPLLALISEKLSKLGIEASIAVKERAYGQDIFCTKICGRIIESRFCIVILDDTIKKKAPIPNPNVYFEYGIMTSLGKHIIPLQKDRLKLAFNIQSHDTIKYKPENIDSELERGIREAVKVSEAKEAGKTVGSLATLGLLRRMELAGFVPASDEWFLGDVIDDTGFKGFSHTELGAYAYVGKIDTPKDLGAYLDDLDIVVYRTERKASSLIAEKKALEKKMKSLQEGPTISRYRLDLELQEMDARLQDINLRLKYMDTIYIAFFARPDLDIAKFIESAAKKLLLQKRYKLAYSQDQKLQFGDITIDHHLTED